MGTVVPAVPGNPTRTEPSVLGAVSRPSRIMTWCGEGVK
jgi:hypothetical protein